jgi:hypothetical protein
MALKPSPDKKTPKAPVSLGYPHIEALLETENFSSVNKSFGEVYQKLETIMKDRSAGLKKQKNAQKAIVGYELTVGLMNELLKIKKEMQRLKAEEAKTLQKK